MITLEKVGNAIRFTFDDSGHYLYNGTIDVPINSLNLIIDESDMVTFRKSASNDIFISARYQEFGMSKADLEEWYKTNMVGDGGVSTGFADAEYVWDATEQKMKLKYYNAEGDLVDFVVLFDTFPNGDILLPNRTF